MSGAITPFPQMLSYNTFNMRDANFSVMSISTYMSSPVQSHETDGRNCESNLVVFK